MRKKQFSYFSFQNFFSDFERNFFQTFCEKSSKSCQNYLLRVQRNNLWLEIFFESFESFWYFLQKPLAWFSNFYLRVQSKNCGRNSFLIFFSDFFRILSEKFFRLSAKKLQKVVKTNFYVSRGTVCGLNCFLKVLNRFDIFCRNLWHGSQTSIYVSRVKIAEETVFWFSFQNFFGFWAKIFSDFRRKIFKSCQNYLLCVQRNNLWLEFFFKFWIVLDFLHKPLAWFSNVHLPVQSKNCGRKSFLIFLFRIFFGFWEKNFPDFRPKNFIKFSKLPSTCPEEQFVAWNFFLKFWIVLDLLQKPSAWFSIFYLRVKSKIAEETVFLFFFSEFFSDFERKIFQTFGQKTS